MQLTETGFLSKVWEAPKAPSEALVQRLLKLEGHEAITTRTLPVGSRSPEQQDESPVLRWLLEGSLQISFPGYGVKEVHPGDQWIIPTHLVYDLTVLSNTAVVWLESKKAELIED